MATPLTPAIPLRSLDLSRPLAAGAFGEVWRAVHRARGTPVAVKLLRAPLAQDPRALHLFRVEAERWAGLDHPGIVTLLDQGIVPLEAQVASGGQLRAGTPYLVMEYASGGPLSAYEGALAWEVAQGILRAVLDALAYAHARGVVHRDLKPANLLLATAEDARPGLKLTDFGTAHLWRDASAHAAQQTGTPAYMAPEQWRGGLASQGPWTDLYALGCIAVQLASGAPPFGTPAGGRPLAELEEAHCHQAPVVPTPVGWPAGFEAWARRLLAKRPADRLPDAATARAALDALGRPPAVPVVFGSATITFEAAPEPVSAAFPGWRAALAPRPVRLLDAGLGLFGLRVPRYSGRDAERDRLWARLAAVADARRPLGVVVRGGTGTGKTRLAGWLAERAAELGVAEALARPPGARGRAAGDVEGVLTHAFRLAGLGLDAATAQLARVFAERGLGSEADARTFAAALVAGTEGALDAPRPERAGAVLALLGRLAQRRPLVLVLDDVESAPGALAFARRVFETPDAPPLLLVLTVNADQARELPDALQADLTALLAHPALELVDLPPLPPEDQRALVASLLPLEPGLLARLVAACGGNPLHLVEVLGDWIDRDLLVPGPAGFHLSRDEAPSLPDRLYQVWPARLARCLDGLPDRVRDALVVAAALGGEVATSEWEAACAAHGSDPEDTLVDRLARAGLVVRQEAGWAFAHEMVRAAVQRAAEDDGAWPEANAACAAALAQAPGREPRRAERVGKHLLAAGRVAEALPALLAGVDEAIAAGRVWDARALLDERDAVVAPLRGPAGERARLEGELRRARLLLLAGDFVAADQTARRVAEGARTQGIVRVRAHALYLRAQSAEKRRDADTAEALYDAAEGLVDDDTLLRAACLQHRGTLARFRGEQDEAARLLEEARGLYEAEDGERGVAQCWTELASTRIERGDLDGASEALERAERLYARLGDRGGESDVLNNRGDLLRRRGDLAGARACFARAVDGLHALGSGRVDIPVTNLALVTLALGDVDGALERFGESLALAGRPGRAWLLRYARLGLLVCRARRGEWAEARRELDALLATGELDLASPELADLARQAWEHARQEGHGEAFAELRSALARAPRR